MLIPETMNIVGHDIEPVHMLLEALEVEILEIPVTGRKGKSKLPSWIEVVKGSFDFFA